MPVDHQEITGTMGLTSPYGEENVSVTRIYIHEHDRSGEWRQTFSEDLTADEVRSLIKALLQTLPENQS